MELRLALAAISIIFIFLTSFRRNYLGLVIGVRLILISVSVDFIL
jgi:hypothetical protein